jgi:predicted GNAT superfamily acetyltransferase
MPDDFELRPLQAGDYAAIARIAAATPGFTVPTEYTVWMFASNHGDLCRVAVANTGDVIGYTLAMMTSQHNVAFSWQTAVVPSHRARHVAVSLLANIAIFARANGVTFARFTCTAERLETMTSLVAAAKLGKIIETTPVPTAWGIDEIEICLKIQ